MSRILLEKGDGLSAIADGIDVPPGLRLVEVITDDGAPSKGAVAPELVLAPRSVAYLEGLAKSVNADAGDGRFVRYELFVVGPHVSDAAPSSAAAPGAPTPQGGDERLLLGLAMLWTWFVWLAETFGGEER